MRDRGRPRDHARRRLRHGPPGGVTRLALRRGTVVSVDAPGPATRLTVDVRREQRAAIAYVDLTGPVEPGDDVVVNVTAVDLGLGSGGFDVVHVNLTRGLE